MATKTITLASIAIGSGSGNWVPVADAWSTTSWDGDSGAVTQAGFTGPRTYLQVGGSMEDDGTIAADAIVNSLSYSFAFAVTAPAGNTGTVETGIGTSTPQTWSGNTSGSCADTVADAVGLTWAVTLAEISLGWLFKADSSAQAGGSMRIVITDFTIVVDYTAVAPPVVTTLDSIQPSSGASTGGDTVTLRGHGFAAGVVPTFDGLPATNIVLISALTLTCSPPVHAIGSVDVAIAGYGTLTNAYRYLSRASNTNVINAGSAPNLPHVPAQQPPINAQTRLIDTSWLRWLNAVKQRVEAIVSMDAQQIVSGVMGLAQIPPLPWSRIQKAESSLADLVTRSASDLNDGVLAQRLGGTGRANAYNSAPGSFTVNDGTFVIHLSRVTLTAIDRVTVLGTGRMGIL